MTIRFLSTDGGGGYRWRSEWPALSLAAHGQEASVHRGWPLGLGKRDVIVCHRPLGLQSLEMLKVYRDAGIKVLVSEDDDIRQLPSSFDWPVRVRAHQVAPSHDQAIEEADGLIVTTQELADVYGSLAKRTWILPNRIPAWVLDLPPWERKKPGPPRVGWAAVVHVHRHDLLWLAPHAEAMLQDAAFQWVGAGRPGDWAPDLLGIPMGAVPMFVTDAVWDVRAFYEVMAQCDIGIVPLDLNETLNRSKSACKALEYMALGKPVVVVDLPEQRAMVEHGVTGFVASTPDAFASSVQELVHDPDLRASMGAAGKERARQFTAEGDTGWAAMVKDLAPKRKPKVTVNG